MVNQVGKTFESFLALWFHPFMGFLNYIIILSWDHAFIYIYFFDYYTFNLSVSSLRNLLASDTVQTPSWDIWNFLQKRKKKLKKDLYTEAKHT